ncbi:MAG: ATP synthase F1 subunit epsilon [Sphingobacteriaceae bacterium]|jgi:F-type H+-transporting ATPase subunit epsilon|nr:ATP synthase F1 subunit epsilon [Sphingobacteriaceae bacterium]
MQLEILTPDRKLFEGEVTSVKVPGSKGQFEVLKNHAPIISSLEKEGKVRVITSDNKTVYFDVKGGVIEVLKDKVIILTEA